MAADLTLIKLIHRNFHNLIDTGSELDDSMTMAAQNAYDELAERARIAEEEGSPDAAN